ncbi:MAG: ABC transporter permease [Actinomycetota bacterium]|nr:ABC transporter permease [Actinomycetota bacterium]
MTATSTSSENLPPTGTPAANGAVPKASTVALGRVLATGDAPPLASPLTASFTFAWRAVRKIRHVPMQLFDVTMFPIMFTLLFTYLFGGALAGSTSAYLQDLLPGILVMTVAMITPYTGMGLNQDIQKGIFDRFRSMPIWGPAVLVGALLGDLVRYSLAAVITIVLGVVLGFRPDGGVVGVVAAVALLLTFSFSLSWIWTLIGFKMQTPENVMQVSMMILFPLTFASNVFVDPDTMPGWVQAFVDVNPVTHLTTAARELMHGRMDTGSVMLVLVTSAALVAVFAPLTMRSYRAER